LFGRHRLVAPDGDAADPAVSLDVAVVGPITVGYLHVSSATELQLAGTAPRFLVATPAGCSAPVRCGASSFDATSDRAVVIQPGRPVTMLLPVGATTLVVGVERQPLLIHLSRLLGRALDRPLVFDPQLDLGAGTASRWNVAVNMLHAELLEHGSLLRSGIGEVQLAEFLMSSLLYGHRSTYSADLARPDLPAQHPATRAATDFIEANLAERLTLSTVASAAGVSPRTLQAAFRSELRTTPTTYIRSRRLAQARTDLAEAAAAEGATVTGVATRWGITHLGRFASEYRQRFGETPSQTLRRSARPGR